MPRVVILATYFHPFIGGVESNATRFALYLKSQEVPVQVVTKRGARTLPNRDHLDGVAIRRVGPPGDRSAAGKWLIGPAVLWWLVRHRGDYDVVCVIDYRGIGVPAVLGRALTGRPVLLQGQTTGVLSGTIEQLTTASEGTLVRLLKWLPRRVYRRADGIACISRVLEREALGCGVPRSRVHFLPNAIDMRQFRPPTSEERTDRRGALGVRPDQVVCLFVGRLSVEKGLMELVEAWRLAAPNDAVLLVAGPDMVNNPWDAGPSARSYVTTHHLEDSVRFLGASTDVRGLLHAADILIQPSHFEAQGLSAVEALACGVPVIASGVGGLMDFVIDGVNGRLVPPRDSQALATAIQELVHDHARRHQFADAARSSVECYDERVVFAQMAELLATLARSRPR